MSIPWQFTFHVAADSDFQTRYDTVLAGHPVPSQCVADTAMAHDLAVEMITNHGIVVPMDCSFNGWWDADNIRSSVTVQINQA
jgi:hypothetical protein